MATQGRDDAAARLWWGIRSYAWILLLVVAASVGASYAGRTGSVASDKTYRASALVVASQLTIKIEGLPRLAESVFEGGAVAERAVTEGRLPFRPEDLIPKHAELITIQGTVAMKVVGIDHDPAIATRIANDLSTALVFELNKAGPGVGTFIQQDVARTPLKPEVGSSTSVSLAIGLVAGLALGLGLIGAIMVIRRPVLGAVESGTLIGAPLLGMPLLPKVGRRVPIDPVTVRGLRALTERLSLGRDGACVLVSCGGDEMVRSQLALLIARTLSQHRPAYLVRAASDDGSRAYQDFDGGPNLIICDELPSKRWRAPVVYDGPAATKVDVPQTIPAGAGIVLVVRNGARFAAVEEAVNQFLPGELEGFVFVRRRRLFRWIASPTATSARPQQADFRESEADREAASREETQQADAARPMTVRPADQPRAPEAARASGTEGGGSAVRTPSRVPEAVRPSGEAPRAPGQPRPLVPERRFGQEGNFNTPVTGRPNDPEIGPGPDGTPRPEPGLSRKEAESRDLPAGPGAGRETTGSS